MEVKKSVTPLCGWCLYPVGGDYPFWVLSSLLVELPLLGFGLVNPKKVGNQPQRAVTTNKGWSPTSKSNLIAKYVFDSTSVFLEYFGLKIIKELSLGHFRNLHK